MNRTGVGTRGPGGARKDQDGRESTSIQRTTTSGTSNQADRILIQEVRSLQKKKTLERGWSFLGP